MPSCKPRLAVCWQGQLLLIQFLRTCGPSSRVDTTYHLPALPGSIMPDSLMEALVQQQGIRGGGQLPLVGVQPAARPDSSAAACW